VYEEVKARPPFVVESMINPPPGVEAPPAREHSAPIEAAPTQIIPEKERL